jgi:tetratricopeptide (TPR) repeat protein
MARPAGADEIVALHREARHEEALAAIMEPLTGKDSRAADQTDQAVRLLNELALASMQRGAACFSFEAAFAYLRRAQKLLNVSPALKAVTLNNLSIYHSRTHQPHAAERCLQRALELIGGVARPHGAHADGDDISVHICLNLTTVLADIGRHRDSLSMAQQAVKALGRQKKPSAGSTLPDPTVQLASAAYYNLAVQQERLRTGNGGAGFAQSYRAAIAEAKRGGTVTQEAAWLAAAHAATHRPKTSTRLLKARQPPGLAARMPRRAARRARVPTQGADSHCAS